jgi:hypothetical protein
LPSSNTRFAPVIDTLLCSYVRLLLSKSANVSAQDVEGCLPIHIAASSVFDATLEEGADSADLYYILSDSHSLDSVQDQFGRTPVSQKHGATLDILTVT